MAPVLTQPVNTGGVVQEFGNVLVCDENGWLQAPQTADHQELLSAVRNNYLGRVGELKPPSDCDTEQLILPSPPQFADEEDDEEFDWRTPPPPVADLGVMGSEWQVVPPPPSTTHKREN